MIPLGPITLDTTDSSVKVLGKLEMKSMRGVETLGQPFEYELELVSSDGHLDLAELLGKPMTVRLELGILRYRYWNGIVTDIGFAGSYGRHALYRVTLRPKFSLLERTSNCRIFQNQTVPAIVKDVLGAHGFGVKESLSAEYASREFVVQYGETDFHFVSRLLEQEGIYYFFRHDAEQHELVLADSFGAHASLPGYERVPYFPPDAHRAAEIESIDRWELRQSLIPASFVAKDYDFERPVARPESSSSSEGDHALKGSEIFEYGGSYLYPKRDEEEYKTKSHETQRDVYTRIRLEEMHASFEQIRATSNARGLCAGALFKLTEFPRDEQNREYLIVSTQIELRAHDLLSGEAPVGEPFRCTIKVLDSKRPFRPKRTAPKPLIRGPQTARVVGPEDDEIWTDQYGRVKVLFHWDRESQGDENSSCWVRVAQIWAGSNWGAMHIPRIGQEVIVEFLEGDPDRPLITGRVYNHDNMPPYELPAKQTQSGIKSRSSKKGSPSNFNEIRFEDMKGKEELYIQAEKQQTTLVKANQNISVGGDRTISVAGNETTTIKKDRKLTVEGEEKIHITKARHDSVDANVDETYGALHRTFVKMAKIVESDTFQLTAKHGIQIIQTPDTAGTLKDGEVGVKAEKSIALACTDTQLFVDGQNINLTAATQVEVKAGAQTTITVTGDKVEIKSMQATIACGASTIELGPDGITVSGTMLKLNG